MLLRQKGEAVAKMVALAVRCCTKLTGPGIRWAVLALPIFVILVNGACAVNHLR